MSEQILEQVSTFLDGELPDAEAELLLKRLTRDAQLRENFGRYALIGESMRGSGRAPLSQGLTARVNRSIDGEQTVPAGQPLPRATRSWWRPVAGALVAAGVAAIAVVALQQRASVPAAGNLIAAVAPAQPREALSYTVPSTQVQGARMLPAARLTNYVFAHSQYSSVLGHSNVLSGLLSATDSDDSAVDGGARDAHVAP